MLGRVFLTVCCLELLHWQLQRVFRPAAVRYGNKQQHVNGEATFNSVSFPVIILWIIRGVECCTALTALRLSRGARQRS